ncbi:DUF3710 domain-containing protein [Gordonia sp. ABSL1-1]|uniref:DUF3710 domain-containing protein n=1 Tax=Gordonia sp. ABSL1-1 TaxID=3053923 RepID=UPI0025725954|nr:DUF3710 domain-containing protein [Gordonia sp. ABSL1-1]MDL9936393.1 DUF3710 domain-containing protein [Gordonia sp. ABSL1-1]
MAREGGGELRIGEAGGPYDFEALATDAADLENSHLDLGSVLVPVVEGGQVTVEMSADHQLQAVYLVTPVGRITVSAFAAPKSPGLWREVVRELATSLRDDGAATSIEDGHWGREVVAVLDGNTHRFIGVDGPRWMVRLAAGGPSELSNEMAQLARAVLAETVVRRGTEPFPPREPLPIVLPPVLAEQVNAAQQQMMAELDDTQGGGPGATIPEATSDARSVDAPTADDVAPSAEENAAAGGSVPGGAKDQVAQATVWNPQAEAVGAEAVVEEADDEDEVPPSEGSAMQRFRRFGRRRTDS